MKKWVFLLALCLGLYACGEDEGGGDPTEPDGPSFEACGFDTSSQTLEIATWNIENFPKSSLTLELVESIIENYDLDVIALQEITSMANFNSLIDQLEGWNGFLTQVNNSNLMLGYLYKSSEITVSETPVNLYEEATSENNDAFTAFRRPYLMKVEHTSGLTINLINVHLKCCNGSEDRRRSASALLKTYIDNTLATEEVIVLGDFNDEIVDTDNVFQNFLDDSDNFRFSTLPIAQGPSADRSFPSFGSQIDQILITNELFDNEVATEVIKIDNCLSTYFSTVSDHRPVVIKLNSN